MSDPLLEGAAALAESGVLIARAWGVRPSIGRGWRCSCYDEFSACRADRPGAHAVHAAPFRTATRDPDVLAGWRRAFGPENLIALAGARSRLAALEFAGPEALQAALRRFGPLPLTAASTTPGGSTLAWFRWARPPVVDPDALGADVHVHGEGGRLLVPGSRLLDGSPEWVVSPANARLAGLPLGWRAAILDAPGCRVFRTA